MFTHFGNYLLDEPIATGGMARVYRARLCGLGGFEKPLVVKQVLPELARDPRFVEMFVHEAKTLVAMGHPHIVPVYELGVVDGIYFLAMEYVEGATIAQMLHDGPLPPPAVAQLMLQVSDALEYAHSRFGILHRDLSPRNIIVDAQGHARLLDFGVSTHVACENALALGSPGYTAPEQLCGERLTAQSDLFSLGAVIFEALRGSPAFLREDRAATRRALLDEPPPALPEARLPGPLVDLVADLLQHDPTRRPQSAHEVGRRLRAWLSQHAPEGALDALAQRVASARAAEETRPRDAEEPPVGGAGAGSFTPLATSPLLDEARRQSAPKLVPTDPSTRPITGRKPAPQGRPPDPAALLDVERPAHRQTHPPPVPPARSGWRWVSVMVLASLTAAALWWWTPSDEAPASAAPAAPPAAGPRPASAAVASPEPPPASEAPARPAPEEPSPVSDPKDGIAARQGVLHVNALPWAEVEIDGRSVGTTPLRGRRLRAGTHQLRVHCPPLGRTERLKVQVRSGEATRLVVDLQQTPARVQVR